MRFLRRLAVMLRNAGGFSAAEDIAAVKRHVKAARERLGQLEGIDARLRELRRENRDLRTAVARLEKAVGALPTTGDVRGIGAAVRQSQQAHAKLIGLVRRDSRVERQHLERLQSQVLSLLRRAHLEPERLAYPYRLTAQRFGALSQHGEDGVTLALLREMGQGDCRFVEIGCSDHGWNTGFLAEECGWSGLMVDDDERSVAATRLRFQASTVRAIAAFLTPDTIDEFFRHHGFGGDCDLVSIDVDGSDYWLWRGLTVCRPRLVIVEYNSAFGGERAVVVPYEPGRVWDADARDERYFGASLRAVQQLGLDKGYRLVAIEPDSANAFFLRSDVAPAIPAADAGALFRPQRKYRKAELAQAHDVFTELQAQKLPLLDVPPP